MTHTIRFINYLKLIHKVKRVEINMKKINSSFYKKIIVTTLIFWVIDFIFHSFGFEETLLYHFSRLLSALVFSFIWFFFIDKKERWKKVAFTLIFAAWLSLYNIGIEYVEQIMLATRTELFLDLIIHFSAFYRVRVIRPNKRKNLKKKKII
jgi:hypothetical protein